MSDTTLGVLRMPDNLFWSGIPLYRDQINQVRKEAADLLEQQEERIEQLEAALKENHEHHLEYGEDYLYKGSELYERNLNALVETPSLEYIDCPI